MARRLSTEVPYTCVTCEVEISGPVTFHVGLPFCCSGCVADGPCTCSYDQETADARVDAPATVPTTREQAVAGFLADRLPVARR
jgi:hypothetical protein